MLSKITKMVGSLLHYKTTFVVLYILLGVGAYFYAYDLKPQYTEVWIDDTVYLAIGKLVVIYGSIGLLCGITMLIIRWFPWSAYTKKMYVETLDSVAVQYILETGGNIVSKNRDSSSAKFFVKIYFLLEMKPRSDGTVEFILGPGKHVFYVEGDSEKPSRLCSRFSLDRDSEKGSQKPKLYVVK